MKLNELFKKVAAVFPARELEIENPAAAARAKYAQDLAAYEAAQAAAVAAIRLKLGNPYWQPRSWIPTGLRPPVNPAARITIPTHFDEERET